jgi:hypothetical protein
MSPESKKRLAMARLRERARRISLIRRSVVAAAVATFALAWGLALNDQIAHGTKTSPTSDTSRSANSTAIPSSSEETGSDEGYVPVTPVQSNVVPVAPTPAPAPAPLTTSQS